MTTVFSKRLAGAVLLLAALALAACAGRAKQPARPNGVALAPDGSLWIMELGNHQAVQISPEGRRLRAFGKLGTKPSDLYDSWGMALDQAGNVYFCDRLVDVEGMKDYESVKVFTPNGQLVRELTAADDFGRDGCYSVRIDPEGRVFAVYSSSNQLRVFNQAGQLLATLWGKTGDGPGEFDGLHDVALDSRRNLLYATDSVNSRVQQFTVDVTTSGGISLTHRLTFGAYGTGPGEFAYPQYLAVDQESGRVYVGDMANRRIQVFDSEGQFLQQFAPPDVKDWQVLGMTVGPDGAVYAADAYNSVIWVFEPDGRVRKKIEVTS